MSYQKIEQVTRFALDGKGETLSADEVVDLFNSSVDKCKRLQELFSSSVEKCERLHEEIRELKHLVREAGSRLEDGGDLLGAIDRLKAERDKFRTKWFNAMGAAGFFAMIAIVGSILVGAVMLGLVTL